MTLDGGSLAAGNGKGAEDIIAAMLEMIAPYERQLPIGLGIYGTTIYVDFFVPSMQIIVESKWQGSAGTVDEKLPYLAENILCMYPHKTLVVLSGSGWRPGAVAWLKQKLQPTEHEAMTTNEFMAWALKSRRDTTRQQDA